MNIDKIRAALELGAAMLIPPTQAKEALTGLAELEAELVELRARLAAIEAAPTVAWQWMDTGHFRKYKPDGAEVFNWRPLIARPEAK